MGTAAVGGMMGAASPFRERGSRAPTLQLCEGRVGVWLCVSAEAEDVQGDGGAWRVWHQLQHGAVCELCEAAGVSAAVCGDADEYRGAAGMRDAATGECVQLLDGRGTEQLQRECGLSAGAFAGADPRPSADTAARDPGQ